MSLPDRPDPGALVTALRADYLKRAAQCERYADQHRRDGQSLSAEFHKGAAMAFRDMAAKLSDELETPAMRPAPETEAETVIAGWRKKSETARNDRWCNTELVPIWLSIHQHRAELWEGCADELSGIVARWREEREALIRSVLSAQRTRSDFALELGKEQTLRVMAEADRARLEAEVVRLRTMLTEALGKG